MAMKNKSMYAILGILNLSPSTGYDIKKYTDQVLSSFWHENYGHIYPTLKMLLAEDMICVVNGEKNSRKVQYEITDKGKLELEAWLLEETLQQPVRSEFMLKLLFSNELPKEQILKMLKNYKQLYANNLEKYNGMQDNIDKGIPGISKERSCFLTMVLKRGILTSKAVVQWCDESMDMVNKKE